MECSNGFHLSRRFDSVSGPFWAKKGCFGAQNAQFWEGTSRLGAPYPGRPYPGVGAPPVIFWLKTWIWQGHHLGFRMARVEYNPER